MATQGQSFWHMLKIRADVKSLITTKLQYTNLGHHTSLQNKQTLSSFFLSNDQQCKPYVYETLQQQNTPTTDWTELHVWLIFHHTCYWSESRQLQFSVITLFFLIPECSTAMLVHGAKCSSLTVKKEKKTNIKLLHFLGYEIPICPHLHFRIVTWLKSCIPQN